MAPPSSPPGQDDRFNKSSQAKPSRHLRSPRRAAGDSSPSARPPRFQLGTAIPQVVLYLPRAHCWGHFRGLFLPPSPGIGKRWLLFTQQPFYKASPHPAGETEVPVGIGLALDYSLLGWGVSQGDWAVPSGRGHSGAGLDTGRGCGTEAPAWLRSCSRPGPFPRRPPQSSGRRNSRLWDRVQRGNPGVAAGSQAWSNPFSCSWCLRPRLLPT